MPEEDRGVAKEEQTSAASTSGTDDEPELYKADDFRMYCMKVLPCSKRFCHDWTVCPYSHPGEKAKRRDPRLYSYTGIACPNMKKDQSCTRGDACPYAHNVFEYWLHPTRYRTQLCNDGDKCARKICFFAHTLEELRVPANKPFVPPEALAAATTTATMEAARKAEGSNKAGLQMLSALLKAQPGNGDSDLLKILQAKVASAQTAQEQQVLVDALAALLQSCGFVQEPAAHSAGRKSFDGVKAHSVPPMPKDDRLELGASGKSRSDPARTRSLRAGGARSRGRHSIDLGHDLKRAMAAQTIHEDASLPTLKSIVEALASNKDFLQQAPDRSQQQQQSQPQPHFSLEELAAFSAGMAAAADAGAAQQMAFSDGDLHLQQQQLLAAAAAASYGGGDWSGSGGVDPALLQTLQAAVAAQQAGGAAAAAAAAAGFGPDSLPMNWNRRQRGNASLPAGPGAYSLQAAAQARARAALTGEPWMGDGSGSGVQGGQPRESFGGGWATTPGDGGGPACHGGGGMPGTTGLYSAFSEPAMRSSVDFLASGRDESWAEVPGGLSHLWQAEPEGMDTSGGLGMYGGRYEGGRLSTDSRRSCDSSYMAGHEYMPHCAPIDEHNSHMRTSMDSMRFSIDSMRSAGSSNGTPGGPPHSMGPYTDYRGSSLFAFSGPFSAAATAASGGNGSGHGAKAAGEMLGSARGSAPSDGGDGYSRA